MGLDPRTPKTYQKSITLKRGDETEEIRFNITDEEFHSVVPRTCSKKRWWVHGHWAVILLGFLLLILISARWYWKYVDCQDCNEFEEVSNDLRERNQEEIKAMAEAPLFEKVNPPVRVENTQRQTTSSSHAPAEEKELDVASEEVLLRCFDLVQKYNSKYGGLLTFEKPDGFSKEVLVAAIAARECGGNPNATNGLSGSDLAVGFLQTKQIRIDELNRIFPGLGISTLADVKGEHPGIKNSLRIYSQMIRHHVKDSKERKNLNVLINSQLHGMRNPNSTPYSRCVIKNMERLRDALKRRGLPYETYAVSGDFYQNPVPWAKWNDGAHHDGKKWAVDMFADLGTKVYASADGFVKKRGYERDGNDAGNRLNIEDDNCVRLYAHLDRVIVNQGQKVKKGQLIGTVGHTGNASSESPHLHYEIWPKEGKYISFVPWTKWKQRRT